MKHTAFRSLLIAALFAVSVLVVPMRAQTTVSSTTLDEAVSSPSQLFVIVASATGIEVNDFLFVDHEIMRVTSISGTRINVRRGQEGTAARAHGDDAILYHGPSEQFYRNEVVPGSNCTATSERFLPRIVIPTGRMYQCTGGVWQQLGAEIGTVIASFVQGGTAADALDTVFFIADRPYVVSKIQAVWSTAESTGSMDIMVEKLTGTTACASGTDLQTSAIAGTGTANTVNTATLSATASSLLVAAGDRLCVDLSATPNEVVGMVVQATLVPR